MVCSTPGFCSSPQNTVEQDHQKAQCHKEAQRENLKKQDSKWVCCHVVLPSVDAQIRRSIDLRDLCHLCCPCWELWSQPWKSHEFTQCSLKFCDSVYGIFCDWNIALHEHRLDLAERRRATLHRLDCSCANNLPGLWGRMPRARPMFTAQVCSKVASIHHPVIWSTQKCSKMLSKYHESPTASLNCIKLPGRGWCLQATCSTCNPVHVMCDWGDWSFA